jgi:hypothetical protein
VPRIAHQNYPASLSPSPTGRTERIHYYYAEAADGAFWAGPYVAEVTQSKFEKCTCLGVSVSGGPPPYHDVGFRELDAAEYSGVNFVG